MRLLIILFIGVLFSIPSFSQEETTKLPTDTSLVVLSVNSGEEFVGTIISEDAREITIRLQNGKLLVIPTYSVKSINPLSKSTLINGKPIFPNPHPSRYFYTPSAIPMDKGEIYIQTLYGLAYQVQFGLTKNFSLGATSTIIGAPLGLTGKYSIQIDEKNTVAFGGLAGIVGWRTSTNLGIGFAAYTYGSKEANITLAGGYAWINKKYSSSNNSPVLNLSGNKRLTKNLSLMGELWYLPENGILFGGPCFRLYGNKRASYDFGIWAIKNTDNNCSLLLPVVGYTYKFDK